MALYVGDSDNIVLMLGDTEVSAAYIGDLQVYPLSPFAVSPSTLHLNNLELTAQIRIKSPEAWTITETSGGWLTLSANSGTAGVTIVTVTASENAVTRNATITVTTANYTKTVAVEQSVFDVSSVLHFDNVTNTDGILTSNGFDFDLEYSYNGINWTSVTGEPSPLHLSVPANKSIFLRGINAGMNPQFVMDVDHTIGGNLWSIIDKVNCATMTSFTAHYGMNVLCRYDYHLISADDLNFGAVTTVHDNMQYDFAYTGLTKGPDFRQITNVTSNAFYYMFAGSSNLNIAIAPSVSSWSSSHFYNWLYGVAATGIVVMDPNTTNVPTNSTSGIPTGWTRVDSYYSLTLSGADEPFDYATSDGRSGSIAVGDTVTLRLDYPQTLSITTAGSKYHLEVNGTDKGNGPTYTLDYLDLANGDVLTCVHNSEPS